MVKKLFLIALAGGFGSVARFGLSNFVHIHFDKSYPWGTTVVNLAGCFLFGLVWSMAEGKLWMSSETKAILLIGFMGAFTTFSTFIFDTHELLNQSQWLLAAANVALQVFLGFACFLGAVQLGKMI